MAADLLAALIGASLAGSAAILLVLLVRSLVRRLFGAVAAYGLWLIVPAVIVASLLPARAPDALPLDPAPLRPAAEIAVYAAADWVTTQVPVAAEAAPLDLAPIILFVWMAGALAFAILLVGIQRRTVRRFGELVHDRAGGVPVLRAATNDAGPAVIGGLRPKVVVPYEFETLFTPTEQALVLAHERAHIAFSDPKVNGLIALIRCLNWFNPLVHVGAILARVDQELACDAAVVASHPGERRSYAEALLKSQLAPASLPLGCYWPVRSQRLLKERIEMLAIERPGLARRLMGAGAIAAVGLTAAYTAWAAEPPQQIAALSPRPVVTAASPAPAPNVSAVSYVLPPPTPAQYAALAVDSPSMVMETADSPSGTKPQWPTRGGVDVGTALLYSMHVQNVASGPRRSQIPTGYVVEDQQSLWLADGGVIPSIQVGPLPNGVVNGLWRPGAEYDGVVKYRVNGDGFIVDQVMITGGKAIAVDGIRVKRGETAVVQLAGGHILSLTPRLRPMTPEEREMFEGEGADTPADLAETEAAIRRLINPQTTASPGR